MSLLFSNNINCYKFFLDNLKVIRKKPSLININYLTIDDKLVTFDLVHVITFLK